MKPSGSVIKTGRPSKTVMQSRLVHDNAIMKKRCAVCSVVLPEGFPKQTHCTSCRDGFWQFWLRKNRKPNAKKKHLAVKKVSGDSTAI